jgi:hypothetical protein
MNKEAFDVSRYGLIFVVSLYFLRRIEKKDNKPMSGYMLCQTRWVPGISWVEVQGYRYVSMFGFVLSFMNVKFNKQNVLLFRRLQLYVKRGLY